MITFAAKHILGCIATIIVLVVFPCSAQNGTTSKIDDYVQTEMKKQRIPGISLAIVKNGQIVIAKGYGLANVEHQVPVKPETIFQSGSMGKQFTATAVMMLVEEGKVSLDEKISKYLGEVPEAWQNMTVRHLLTHTSGLTDYPEDFDFRRDYTEDELLKRAQAITPAFKPGEKWQYSNLAYVTLGILIHKVSGQFYGDFLQARVFKPLGMSNTRIISEADIVTNRAAGYRYVKDELKNQNWVSPTLNTTADGALYFNVLDVAKWDAALYGESLLKTPSLQQMWTPVRLNNNKTFDYGFGWGFSQMNGHRVIEHGGAWQGFTSYIGRYVDDRITVIVLDNLAGGNAGKIARHVAAIYSPELARKAIEDKEPQVTAFTKDLIQKFAEGTADPNAFTPEGRAEFFPVRSERVARLLKSLGGLTKMELVERVEKDGYRVYGYQLSYEKGTRFFRMNLTQDSKIAELAFIDDF
ncbi:MAG TPA: serine hydrolase domain-containing protein [Pyrinomonadaceae bacterium]|jgi:CubicO group peptidase (beta-lactamase class C family)|nr:serine hydrolase domain-containing protein [Pyrinomonadaceae bacterium]